MNTIGLLGGTSWPSTINYYRRLNELVQEKVGGFHSARLLLSSIDYHEIKSRYHEGWKEIPALLAQELERLARCEPGCIVLCNNTLHKALDLLSPSQLEGMGIGGAGIPVFHAVDLTCDFVDRSGMKHVLLLGTRFTMEDTYFRGPLERRGIRVAIPDESERAEIQALQSKIAAGHAPGEHAPAMAALMKRYASLDAVILACTELPLVVTQETSPIPIVDPTELQCRAAVSYCLEA